MVFIKHQPTNSNAELKAQVEALKDALAKERAKQNTDGTNSSLPTSQTPIGKKKVLPNSRVKSSKKRGAQPGHVKHTLELIPDSEINNTEDHTLESCPKCGSESLTFLEKREKDVIDYEVTIKGRPHTKACLLTQIRIYTSFTASA